MNRPAARKSSLAGTSALTPPPLPEQPPAPELTVTRPAAAPIASKPETKRMNYYVDDDTAGRIRSAYLVGRARYGWRSLTEFHSETMMNRVLELENELNGGEPFEPSGVGSISAGRPLE